MTASVLTDLAAQVGAAAAIVVGIGVVARTTPCRWLWARLVVQPMSSWFRAEVSHVVEPPLAEIREQLRPNGGQSLRDRVDALEGGQGAIGRQVQAVEDRLARWEAEGSPS